MRNLLLALCLLSVPALADEVSEKKAVIATIQKLFDAMAAKDTAAIQAVVLPGTSLSALRPDGQTTVTPIEKFIENIRSAQGSLVERMWDPKVMVEGNIATLWAPYDFHRDGKFTHCGIDVANLLKTPEGWKIGGLSYTVIQQGCQAPK